MANRSFLVALMVAVACGRLAEDSGGTTSTITKCSDTADCQGGEAGTQSVGTADGGEVASGGGNIAGSTSGGTTVSSQGGASATSGDDDGGAASSLGGVDAGGSESGGDGGAALSGAGGAGGAGGAEAECSVVDVVGVPMTCPVPVNDPERPYQVTGLGYLDSHGLGVEPGDANKPVSVAEAINNAGQVAGYALACGKGRAFRFSEGVMTDLGTLPGDDASLAWGINNSGTVVGTSLGHSEGRPFIWRNGVMETLSGISTLTPNLTAFAINDHDQIVLSDWGANAYLWDAGTTIALGDDVFPRAINNRGQVVGYVGSGYSDDRAFVWKDGVMTLLSDVQSEAYGINDRGQIVGARFDGVVRRAVLWQGDEVIDVTPPTDYDLVDSVALGINESGVILGMYEEAGPRPNPLGYVYAHGVFTRLEGSTPGEFASLEGLAINDRGEVAGLTSHWWGSPDQARVWSLGCFGVCCARP